MKTTPGRIIIELDDLASAMLRRVAGHGNETTAAGHDPRDLVSAAVTYYLANEDEHAGKFYLNCGASVLQRAVASRKRLERRSTP